MKKSDNNDNEEEDKFKDVYMYINLITSHLKSLEDKMNIVMNSRNNYYRNEDSVQSIKFYNLTQKSLKNALFFFDKNFIKN